MPSPALFHVNPGPRSFRSLSRSILVLVRLLLMTHALSIAHMRLLAQLLPRRSSLHFRLGLIRPYSCIHFLLDVIPLGRLIDRAVVIASCRYFCLLWRVGCATVGLRGRCLSRLHPWHPSPPLKPVPLSLIIYATYGSYTTVVQVGGR